MEQRAEPSGPVGALRHRTAQLRRDTGRVVDVVLEPGGRDAGGHRGNPAAGQAQGTLLKQQGDGVRPAGGGIRFTALNPCCGSLDQSAPGTERVERPEFGAVIGRFGLVRLGGRVGDLGDQPGLSEFYEVSAGFAGGDSWTPE